MSLVVGPKEIFIHSDDYYKAQAILSKDDQSSVVWFQSLQQKERRQFIDGRDFLGNNVLMMAAQKANATLLKYLCEHIEDPRIINMQDCNGRTALSYLVDYNDIALEKLMVCMKILLDHGADPDVFSGYSRNNLAGHALFSRIGASRTVCYPHRLIKAEKTLEVFLEKGATCFMECYFPADHKQPIAIGQVDTEPSVKETDSPELKKIKTRLSGIVKKTQERTQKTLFSQVRSLRLAGRSLATSHKAGSPIAELPLDIRNLIEEKLYKDVSMCLSDKEKELTQNLSAMCTRREYLSKRD